MYIDVVSLYIQYKYRYSIHIDMFKQVMLSEENVELLKKHGDTPNKAISNLLIGTSVPQTVSALTPELKSAIEEALDKKLKPMFEKYESGQKAVNSELILRLSSLGGHSAPQEGSNGFRRASLREEK